MKKFFYIVFLLCCFVVTAQNKQILYGFDKIPQTLLLNPGAETTYKYHIGIPMFSGVSVNANISGVTIADVFREDSSRDFNTRFRDAIAQLDDNDYIYINSQIDVINGGYKINTRDYLSVGFYSELDAFIQLPKDVFTLINEGSAEYLNRPFSLSQVNAKIDVLGVLHAGISRKLSEELIVGARFKIYSGSLNVTSNNLGTFRTREVADNIYENSLNNFEGSINSAGIYNENDEVNLTFESIFGGTFLSGNFGLGFDVGFTYFLDQQTEITASLLDIGFLTYSKDTRNASIKGDYVFSGIDFQYDPNNSEDYWTQLRDGFEASVPRDENRDSYSVMRPIKFNGSYTYRYGKSRNEKTCHDISFKDYYDNAVGGQLYGILHPNGLRFALTGFYERKFSKHLNTKFTYTIDDFSYTNFGVGISTNIWKVNIYGMVDNIFELSDLADANRASFQLGANLIFN